MYKCTCSTKFIFTYFQSFCGFWDATVYQWFVVSSTLHVVVSMLGKFTFAASSYSVLESAGVLEVEVLFHRKTPTTPTPIGEPQLVVSTELTG